MQLSPNNPLEFGVNYVYDHSSDNYTDIRHLEYNLFSKIGIDASWWRDYTSSGQSNGNYLAYCCLDSTARDFAKFGHMLLLNGVWEGSNQRYSSYVDLIKNLNSYGLQFWTICALSLIHI